MIIAIDFDGTCVTHEYPAVGSDVGAVPVLKRLVDSKHQLILWTMRSGETLRDAVGWFDGHGIPLWGVNGNPEQAEWTTSPKACARLYIDDAALGAPLKYCPVSDREFVDWAKVERALEKMGILPKTPGRAAGGSQKLRNRRSKLNIEKRRKQ